MPLPEGFPFTPLPTDCAVIGADDVGNIVLYFMTPAHQAAYFIRPEAWEQIVQAVASLQSGIIVPQQGLILPDNGRGVN